MGRIPRWGCPRNPAPGVKRVRRSGSVLTLVLSFPIMVAILDACITLTPTLLLLSIVDLTTARFTKAGCFADHCLQAMKNSTGGSSLCFVPDQKPRGGLADVRCASSRFDRLVSIHARRVQQGEPHIAYWNVLDKSVLGGAEWSVHEWQAGLEAGVIAACFTGLRSNGSSTTMCYTATEDDDFAVQGHECHARLACGTIHDTTKPMLRNGCRINNDVPNSLDYILGQYVKVDIGGQWHNLPAAPQKSSNADGEAAIPSTNPMTVYRLDSTACATGIPGAVHGQFEVGKPLCVRH